VASFDTPIEVLGCFAVFFDDDEEGGSVLCSATSVVLFASPSISEKRITNFVSEVLLTPEGPVGL